MCGRLLQRESRKVGCQAPSRVCRGVAAAAGVDPGQTGCAGGISPFGGKQRDPSHTGCCLISVRVGRTAWTLGLGAEFMQHRAQRGPSSHVSPQHVGTRRDGPRQVGCHRLSPGLGPQRYKHVMSKTSDHGASCQVTPPSVGVLERRETEHGSLSTVAAHQWGDNGSGTLVWPLWGRCWQGMVAHCQLQTGQEGEPRQGQSGSGGSREPSEELPMQAGREEAGRRAACRSDTTAQPRCQPAAAPGRCFRWGKAAPRWGSEGRAAGAACL